MISTALVDGWFTLDLISTVLVNGCSHLTHTLTDAVCVVRFHIFTAAAKHCLAQLMLPLPVPGAAKLIRGTKYAFVTVSMDIRTVFFN